MPMAPVLRMRRQADVWVEASLVFLIYRANYRHLSKKAEKSSTEVRGYTACHGILVLSSWAVSPQCSSVENRTNNRICLTGLLWREMNWNLSVWKSTQYTLSLMSWQCFYQWSCKSHIFRFSSLNYSLMFTHFTIVCFSCHFPDIVYILCILAFCLTYMFEVFCHSILLNSFSVVLALGFCFCNPRDRT